MYANYFNIHYLAYKAQGIPVSLYPMQNKLNLTLQVTLDASGRAGTC